MRQPEPARRRGRFALALRWRRSLLIRLLLLIVIFLTVPIALYREFEVADASRRDLLLASIRAQGAALAQGLRPTLAQADAIPFFRLREELAEMRTGDASLKLLFRPAPPQDRGFYYVAASPVVPTEALETERRQLAETGILERLSQSCDGDLPVAIRIDRPDGAVELLTSIVPVRTTRGCWALVVASGLDDEVVRALARPYWRSPEVVLAGSIYLVLAVVVLAMLFDLWRGLLGFGRLAQEVRAGTAKERFSDRNQIPELSPAASELDRLVDSLKGAAESLRHAAEDSAHAFKTPLAVIRQALEPLRRRIDPADERAMNSVEAIDGAVERLEGMVAASRDLDRATADTLDPPRERIDLTTLLAGIVEGYQYSASPEGRFVIADLTPNVTVRGSEEMLESSIENVIENALSFTPAQGKVHVTLASRRGRAILTVEDEGPGVPPDRLGKIFERYYSDRPNKPREPHFGIGLWIVRRNIEALGGAVAAENRRTGGLKITMEMPLASLPPQ